MKLEKKFKDVGKLITFLYSNCVGDKASHKNTTGISLFYLKSRYAENIISKKGKTLYDWQIIYYYQLCVT